MNKKIIFVIITIIMWVLVIIPTILIFNKCMYSYENGTNIALQGTQMVYGISAFKSTLFLYIAFGFPLVIIWIILFIVTIIMTIFIIIKYNYDIIVTNK